MLEIEKQQKRFQDKSVKELTHEYERNFVKPSEKEEPPPNSPYPAEGTGQLPLQEKAKKDKKSS